MVKLLTGSKGVQKGSVFITLCENKSIYECMGLEGSRTCLFCHLLIVIVRHVQPLVVVPFEFPHARSLSRQMEIRSILIQ